jgi:hypothetical protein
MSTETMETAVTAEAPGQARLFAALAGVQANLPRIGKGAEAKIPGKDGQRGYEYKYADLADVAQMIMPLLGKNGLAFTAKPTMVGGAFVLLYKLVHESGESDEGTYPLPDPRSTKPQTVASAITYARRYCLCAVTGVAPDGDDDDATIAQADYQSAGAAFENASPVRPAARQAPAQAKAEPPATTDTEWLDKALAKAASDIDAGQCRKLWIESADKVRGGTVSKDDAKRVQDILKARIEDLGRAAKAAAALNPEDEWAVKVDALISAEDAEEAVAEVVRLFHADHIDTARRDALIGAIAARFPGAVAAVAVPA